MLEDRYFDYIQQARRDAQGRVDGGLVFAFEVTEQVRARQASEASARQLRDITDALPVLIGYLDRDEKYRFANEAYRAWFRQDPAAMLGQPIRHIAGEAAYPNIRPYIQRALAGERVDFETAMPFRPDVQKVIRTTYVPDVQAGQVVGCYTLVFDITERTESRQQVESLNQELRSINAELADSNVQLTRTNEDLDNFIYTASHDLKAPISNIKGLLYLLQEELPPAVAQDAEIGPTPAAPPPSLFPPIFPPEFMAAIACTLLVDDDEATNFLNQTLLRRMALSDAVLVAQNGQEALDLLHQHCEQPTSPTCPALILLDTKMPIMNGFEFLQAYSQRSERQNPTVVIIMLTTSLNPNDVAQMQGLPIAGYLTKPLTRDKVNELLLEHFGQAAPAS